MVKTPNERKRPDLTPEDWEKALENLPLIYARIAKFGQKVMKRSVSWRGEFFTPSFEWRIGDYPTPAYGVDPHSLLEDLEARGLEAAAEAAHDFDETKGFQFSTFLVKVVDRGLRHEFNYWLQTSASMHSESLDPEALDEEADPELFEPEPQPDDGLTDLERDALQSALGVLSSKEAIALRMWADGASAEDIQETCGFKDVANVYQLLKRARTKAEAAYAKAVSQ